MDEKEPKDGFVEFAEAYAELERAIRAFLEELAKTANDILNALVSAFGENQRRRAEVRRLRSEFIRKRGLRR